eukprot:Em0020g865a
MAGAVPFLTAKHAHHSAVWTIKGFSIDQICVACTVEHIENGQALGIHVKRVLGELLALLRSGDKSLYQVISTDKRVQEHLLNIIFVRVKGDEASLCIDALIAFVEFLNTSEPPRKLLQQTVHTVLVPSVPLLGRLLHSQPALCTELVHTYRGFLEYLLSGMTYTDEAVKSSLAYILVQLFSRPDQNSLSPGFVQATCRHISVGLASAKSADLTSNLMALVRNLVKCDRHAQCLLQADQLDSETKGSTFAMAFKRPFAAVTNGSGGQVLLNTDEILQLAAVQCLQDVLTHHSHYCEVLLKADIAEFLCEAIKTKNESLLSSLFICLNALANADSFYSDCHVIYVIDPVIVGINTALWLQNQEVTILGQLKAVLLFVNAEPLAKLLSAMTEAVQQKSLPLSTQTARVLSLLLKSQHVPVNSSLSPVLPLLAQLFQCVDPLSKPSIVQQVLSQPMKLLLTEVLSAADSMYQHISNVFATVLFTTVALSGFIQLSFDTKNKYHYHKRVNSLITAVDEFLVELCAGLVTSKSSSTYVRDILHPTLPHIPSSIVNCMELLNQRATTFLGNGSNSLRDVQSAILLLLHNAFTHNDRLVSWDVLVKVLDGYVSLNPDIHLLPPVIFTCLLVLYAGMLALSEPLVNCVTIVNILTAFLAKEGPVGGVSSSQSMVLSTLERMLLIQRAEGFHGISTVGIFKTLTAAVTACSQPIVEGKLVHHVANIIARTDTEQSFDIAISGMDFLSALLSKHTQASIQVSIVLLNNIPFMQKVTAFIPSHMVHTALSACSMQLLAEIIDCHCLSRNPDVKEFSHIIKC